MRSSIAVTVVLGLFATTGIASPLGNHEAPQLAARNPPAIAVEPRAVHHEAPQLAARDPGISILPRPKNYASRTDQLTAWTQNTAAKMKKYSPSSRHRAQYRGYQVQDHGYAATQSTPATPSTPVTPSTSA